MRSRPWDRAAVIGELRDQLWLHVSPAATRHDITLQAAALLQLPYADVERLGTLHFVLDPAVTRLLDDGPALLRRLASDTSPVTEVGVDRVRGPVDWPATARRRALDRTPVVVTHPRHRDADVQPNRTLALVLRAVRDGAAGLGFPAGADRSDAMAGHTADAGRRAAVLAAHRTLRDVTPTAPTARDLAALRAPRLRRRNDTVLRAWCAYERLVRRPEVGAIRSAVEQRGFAVAQDGALFELLVLFRLREALTGGGWTVERARVFKGSLTFAARRGANRLTVWFQAVPDELRRSGRYVLAQRAHLIGASDLRPDLVLRLARPGTPDRLLVVEAKTTSDRRTVPALARRALVDLLAYRSAYSRQLRDQPVWGLGVVWGSDLSAADHEVGLCTYDRLAAAVAAFVDQP